MTKNRGALAGILIACLAAVAIAGCGGGSDETETQTLSKAQYVKQADAICTETNKKQDTVLGKVVGERSGTGIPSSSEQAEFVRAALVPLEKGIAKLDELGLPSGEEKKAEAFVDALRKAVAGIEKDPAAFSEAKTNPYAPVERQGKELGLQVCPFP